MPLPLNVFYDVQTVQFPASGTFDVLADLGGNTPVGAIVLGSSSQALNNGGDVDTCMSIGFTDGTNHVCVTNAAEDDVGRSDVKNAGYNDEVCALFDASGGGSADDVNINWDSWRTTVDTGTEQTGVRFNMGKNTGSWTRWINVMLFAGSDVDFAVGVTALSTQDTFVDETGPGFEPDIVIALVNDAFGSTERAGFHFSTGIVHNGTSVTGHYSGWFTEDNGDPNVANKEADTTANHCGMHFTGSYSDQHEVECGEFDANGMSFRARNANATDDVGWCAIKLGGLGIDLRAPGRFTEASGALHQETGYSFPPGAIFMLRGAGPGTDGAGDSNFVQGVSLGARNRINGVTSGGGVYSDTVANETFNSAAVVIVDGLWVGDSNMEANTFAAREALGGIAAGELTDLRFEHGVINWFGWGPTPSTSSDHGILLAIEDPHPPLSLLLADKMLDLQHHPTFRM